jgi:hypothetical protein
VGVGKKMQKLCHRRRQQ